VARLGHQGGQRHGGRGWASSLGAGGGGQERPGIVGDEGSVTGARHRGTVDGVAGRRQHGVVQARLGRGREGKGNTRKKHWRKREGKGNHVVT
jgi:hypothetical protein